MVSRFNLRTYGLVVNNQNEILLSHERRDNSEFIKFPGGGVELGEGIAEALKREFKEELDAEIQNASLFYVNDFFQESAYRKTDQIISVYYQVYLPFEAIQTKKAKIPLGSKNINDFEWVNWHPLSTLNPMIMSFPIDKVVMTKLINLLPK